MADYISQIKLPDNKTYLIKDSEAARAVDGGYLPLSGGTMTGPIKHAGMASTWRNGRDNAALTITTANAYSPLTSIKTENGSWELGAYKTTANTNYVDRFLITYFSDDTYTDNGNTVSTQLMITKEGALYPLAGTDTTLGTNAHRWTNIYSNAANIAGTVTVTTGGIWVQGGSAAGSDNTRMALTKGMPDKLPYNTNKRGVFIYSNAIAFADPINGNGNNDAGWIRHLEGTANAGTLEIAVGDDNANEQIVVRRYDATNAVKKEITLFDASGNSSFPGNMTISSNLTVNGTSTLNGNTTISAATPVLQVKSTGTNAATLGLIRNGLSSWQWVNSGGNLYLQNNWDSTSGKAVNYFNVVTYGHTSGTVEIHKNLAVGGTSIFNDEVTLTKANDGANFGIYVNHTNPNSDTTKAKKIALMIGGSSGSGGIYDITKGKWVVSSDTAGNVTLNGNALTASKATNDADNYDIRKKYVNVFNTSDFSGVNTATFTDLAAAGNAMGMIYAATDNPEGKATWVHGISLAWKKGTTSSWISQIALGVSSGTGMWYRTTSGNIAGKEWTKILDASNYDDYAAKIDGSNATGTWGISISGKAGSVDWANTGHPTTFPPSTHDHDSRYALKEHAHGNITSDGKMSGSTVSGAVTTTHKFLREDGTWVVPKYTTDTDTHYTTKLIAGGSAATSNAAVTSGNVYLRLFDDSTHRNNIQFAAGSNMTITSDASGIITFKSSYTNNAVTHTPSQVTKYYLTGTTSSTTTTSGDTYDIDLYTTTTPGELSALRYSLHYGSVEKAHLVYNNTDDSIDFVFV